MRGKVQEARRQIMARRFRFETEEGSGMNEYIPCKRRDPTAWEAIGRVRREEKERRKREAQEKEREADEERRTEDARI